MVGNLDACHVAMSIPSQKKTQQQQHQQQQQKEQTKKTACSDSKLAFTVQRYWQWHTVCVNCECNDCRMYELYIHREMFNFKTTTTFYRQPNKKIRCVWLFTKVNCQDTVIISLPTNTLMQPSNSNLGNTIHN